MDTDSSKFEAGSSKGQTTLNFERLSVYQKALSLAEEVFVITRNWRRGELWGLGDQFRRAALSITLNIAEGSGRTKRDFRNFLRNSRASCYECLPIIEMSRRQGFLPCQQSQACRASILELTRMLSGLMSTLGARPIARTSAGAQHPGVRDEGA